METIPETLTGVRDALTTHIVANTEQFHVMEEKFDYLKEDVSKLKLEETKESEMANETINVGGGDSNMAAMMAMLAGRGGNNDGMLGAGGGLLGGLLLGSLLRNGNGGLFGGNGGGGGDMTAVTQPNANMSIMSTLGDIKQAVAVGTAQMETSQALQSSTIQAQLNSVASSVAARVDGVKDVVNQNALMMMQMINTTNTNISNDGEKTRALITQINNENLNRQLSDANAAVIELRSENRLNERSRGIEVTTTNNINQMQNQQQQQQQLNGLAGLVTNLANDLQYIRATNQAINVGSGTLTANPANTNTNIR